jgi:hypothetical protein
LGKSAKNGFRGYPIGTIALYGPDDKVATKLVVSIVPDKGAASDPTRKWHAEQDVRNDALILNEAMEFVQDHRVRTVAMADRIIGSSHEEGTDYPEGEACPLCPFWKGRDHWTGERIH